MKKSVRVTLTVVATLGLAACNRQRRDPCEAQTFSDQACEEAVRSGGYFWRGTWIPMTYHYPYPFYYDAYRSRIGRGGGVTAAPAGAYTHPSTPGVTRGGFGATGAAHGVGG